MDPRYATRFATTADLQVLLALGVADLEYHRALRPDLPPSSLAQKRSRYEAVLAADNGVIVVVEAHPPGVCVGMVSAFVEPDKPGRPRTLYVEEAWVGREHRRRGLLRALMARLAAWGAERGVERVELDYVVGNELGEASWRRLGFEPRSVRAGAPLGRLR